MEYINTEDQLNYFVKELRGIERIAVDTETTGKYPYHGDRLFSLIAAVDDEEFYFDFNVGEMPRRLIKNFNELFNHTKHYLFFVNAAFDIAMMRNDGINIDKNNTIVDGPVIARLDYNLHVGDKASKWSKESFLSLDYLGRYYGMGVKDDRVMAYIKENNLYKTDVMGDKAPDFSVVPTELMTEYACKDARLTYDVCMKIISSINKKEDTYMTQRPKGYSSIIDLCAQETALTPNIESMMHTGMLVDVPYTEKAFKHEIDLSNTLKAEVIKEAGKDINLNSPKQKANWIMNDLGIALPKKIDKKTKVWKGNYCTDAETMESIAEKHNLPVLNKMVASNQAKKKGNTYYKNFLNLRDTNDIIHCGLGQENAITGRFSSYNPNLQNLTKEEIIKEFMVRKSFIARPGYNLFFFDYKQQEMMVMIDQAEEMGVIQKIKSGEAKDFYIATMIRIKEITGVEITRKQAKAISLGLAYGQGDALLASILGCSVAQAKQFKRVFFSGLPKLQLFKQYLETHVKHYGKIFNPYGRATHIHGSAAYKALNAFVQGMSADITKKAINNCFEVCEGFESNPVLTIHDEIAVEIKIKEEHLVPKIVAAMKAAYTPKHLELGVDVEYSETSWAEKKLYERS